MTPVYHSHLGAAALLESCGLLGQLDAVIRALPTPVFGGKSLKNAKHDVVQQMVNSMFRVALEGHGWLHQHAVAEASTGYYADFWSQAPVRDAPAGLEGTTVRALCEIQLGNVSRLGADFDKFRIGWLEERADVGIEVVPVQALASRVAQSVANFEKARSDISRLKRTGLPVPVLLVGLSCDGREVDLRKHQRDLQRIVAKGAGDYRLQLARRLLLKQAL